VKQSAAPGMSVPFVVGFITAIAALASGCGSSNSATTPTPAPPCSASSTTGPIVIANNAVCPQNITVARGSQVLFINQDSIAHEMYSDPHPEHTDCPELNQVGHLEPGQSRLSGNLNTPRTCGFHDHLKPDAAALKGKITIQ
jgi:plastocyanin